MRRSFILSLTVFLAGAASAQALDAGITNHGDAKAPAAFKKVEGGLAKEDIYKVIKFHQSSVRRCYEQVLVKQPSAEGRFTVHFTIGPDGSVIEADVVEDTIKNEQMASCIIHSVKTWKFPEPRGGGKVTINFPWVFKGQ